jgi:Protein of unknown function (DUF3303)
MSGAGGDAAPKSIAASEASNALRGSFITGFYSAGHLHRLCAWRLASSSLMPRALVTAAIDYDGADTRIGVPEAGISPAALNHLEIERKTNPTVAHAAYCFRRGVHPRREDSMKFMLTFAIRPEVKGGRDEAIARFKKTGGQPPKAVRLLGRWTRADFSGGYDLLETDDAKGLTEFALMWSDLMDLQIAPVLEDADTAEVLGRPRIA